jgi:Flp pilus assembly protein TadD
MKQTGPLHIQEATHALAQALSRDPSNGPFHYALAALLALMGRFDEARAHLKRAEELGVDGKVLRGWLAARGWPM